MNSRDVWRFFCGMQSSPPAAETGRACLFCSHLAWQRTLFLLSPQRRKPSKCFQRLPGLGVFNVYGHVYSWHGSKTDCLRASRGEKSDIPSCLTGERREKEVWSGGRGGVGEERRRCLIDWFAWRVNAEDLTWQSKGPLLWKPVCRVFWGIMGRVLFKVEDDFIWPNPDSTG